MSLWQMTRSSRCAPLSRTLLTGLLVLVKGHANFPASLQDQCRISSDACGK